MAGFSAWVRSSEYLYFGPLRLLLVVVLDTAMTIEEAYCQLVMSGWHPPSHRDDGRGSSRSYIDLSQSSQARTWYMPGSSAAASAASQHGTSSIQSYHAASVFDDRHTTLWADPPPLVLEPQLPVSNMTLSDPFRPSTSYASDRNQRLSSTFQGTLSGKDNRSAATACSSDSVPVMAATHHQDRSAIIPHDQVGLRDKASDHQAMVSDEVQILEIAYLSLPDLRQYLYAMKDPSKLPGPDELDKQLQRPETRKNLVKNMKLLVFHNFVRERIGLKPTTLEICRTCLAERGVFCVPHGQIPGQGCFCPRKRTRGKKLRLNTGSQT